MLIVFKVAQIDRLHHRSALYFINTQLRFDFNCVKEVFIYYLVVRVSESCIIRKIFQSNL